MIKLKINMRRAFQVTLPLVAFLPFVLGTMTLLQGAARFVPGDMVTATLDSQMRGSAIFSMLPFFLAIWIVRNLERAGTVLFIILGAAAAAGLARLLSAAEYGVPGPAMVGAVLFEIGLLSFIPWYRAVVRRAENQAAA